MHHLHCLFTCSKLYALIRRKSGGAAHRRSPWAGRSSWMRGSGRGARDPRRGRGIEPTPGNLAHFFHSEIRGPAMEVEVMRERRTCGTVPCRSEADLTAASDDLQPAESREGGCRRAACTEVVDCTGALGSTGGRATAAGAYSAAARAPSSPRLGSPSRPATNGGGGRWRQIRGLTVTDRSEVGLAVTAKSPAAGRRKKTIWRGDMVATALPIG